MERTDIKKTDAQIMAMHLETSRIWQFHIFHGGKTVKIICQSLCNANILDVKGRKFAKQVDELADSIKELGICKEQIEDAIRDEAKSQNLRLPKYMR